MAYQNVGTPRFYVDILQWLKSQGSLSISSSHWEQSNILDLIGINPSETKKLIPTIGNDSLGYNDSIKFETTSLFHTIMPNDKNFFMVLGHNLATAGASIYLQEGEGTIDADPVYDDEGEEEATWTSAAASGLVNYTGGGSNSTIDHDGFSISIGNDAHDIQTHKIQFRLDAPAYPESAYDADIKIGSLLYGNYYDMPHSPDLSLKMSIEMDGVKNIKTRGGASLTGINYTKPQDWGDMGAWQLGGVSNLRNGRRVWDLSFSYLSDTDVMPNLGIQNYETGATGEDILDGTDFFSQVWNKTMGGHLPFIFQPDKDNANPDQFAICRFDMKSLVLTQKMHRKYNVKLKIRECW